MLTMITELVQAPTAHDVLALMLLDGDRVKSFHPLMVEYCIETACDGETVCGKLATHRVRAKDSLPMLCGLMKYEFSYTATVCIEEMPDEIVITAVSKAPMGTVTKSQTSLSQRNGAVLIEEDFAVLKAPPFLASFALSEGIKAHTKGLQQIKAYFDST